MSFLDLYPEQDAREASFQPNEGTRLPSEAEENFNAAWRDGQLFSQSIARQNARASVLGDYVDEIRAKTGNDLSKEFIPDVAGGGQTGVTNFTQANERVARLKADYPDLDLDPISEDEIDKRAVAKAQAAHRTYESLQAGERTFGGSVGSFFGSAGAAATDPINILALGIAPETKGISILSSALRWGALAGVSQAAIEFQSDQFKEQVQPGYTESGQPLREIGGAIIGGAAGGAGWKVLGNAWTRVKTGAWPTSVRDAGNIIESEANVANTNPFPGVEGEVAHREALIKTIDDILAGRPVDVGAQITPELVQAAVEAERAKVIPDQTPTTEMKQAQLPLQEPAFTFEPDEWGTERFGEKSFSIKDAGGSEVAAMSIRMEGDTARIVDIYAPGGGKNSIGNAKLREILKQFQSDHPEITSITGERVTGAKVGGGKVSAGEGVETSVGLRRPLQTPEDMTKTLTAPDHQDAIRADIDRERALGDFKVPGVDENGNHAMVGVDAAMDQVDAYKKLAEQIQVCANPVQEAAE
jgi:hypothetical protein